MALLLFSATLATLLLVVALARRRACPSHRLLGVAVLICVTPAAMLAAYARLAPLASPYDRVEVPGLVVLDANGVVLQRDASGGLRIPVSLDQVAPLLAEATIAAEDQRFRAHPGVDPIATFRALVNLPFNRSGGSTITQQLARRLYLSGYGGPVVVRKAREALLALQLEARYSKDEVLSLYLNDVYYGRGAYGVEAAARLYFGVSAANLDLAQAAFLAGLPQAPALYGSDPESRAAAGRRRYVLERLIATGHVSPEDAVAALSEPLHLLPDQAPALAPHFVAFALDELRRVRPDLASRQGLVIETTLDSTLQSEAEDIAAFYVSGLKDRSAGNAAVVVIDPASGEILTMVGSVNFWDEAIGGQINMALQPRQPGSALKPFLYLAALERGLTAASPLLDVPSTFQTSTGPYTPLNYDRRFNGVVPMRVALASSLNVPAVRTLDQVGIDVFLETAHRFGLRTLTDAEVYGLALTLGGGEVRLLDLTAAYGAIANAGALNEPFAIRRVRDQAGRVLYEHPASRSSQVARPEEAFIIADILADPDARRLGFGDAPQLRLPFAAAVKTGTTTEFRDNWTIGFTSARVVGVWVGNADNRPMVNVSGVSGAAPIWRAVMEAAHRDVTPSWPVAPAGLVRARVCPPTGRLPGPECPSSVEEWFLPGTAPSGAESYYSRDAAGRIMIDPPAEARAWAAEAGLQLSNTSAGPSQAGGLEVFPALGNIFYSAPEVPGQAIVLRASPPAGVIKLEFLVDGSLAGTALPGETQVVWPVRIGRHVLEVRAFFANGELLRATSSFEVKP